MTLIALTFHALTEVSITFLLSLFIYSILKSAGGNNIRSYFPMVIAFLLVVMTVIKPVFYYPLFVIFPLIIYENLKRGKSKMKRGILFFIIMIPLFLQLGITRSQTGDFAISKIGSYTFDLYLMSQGVQEIEQIGRDEAIEKTRSFSSVQKRSYLLSHFKIYVKLFFKNVWINLGAKSHYLEPNANSNVVLSKWMKSINNFYRILHIAFVIPVLFVFWNLIKRNKSSLTIYFGASLLLLYYYLITTGISFWEGDRLVLPTIALWIPIYCYTINYLLSYRSN